MHDDPEKKFYIPENVYIIGTMNDIDRSVDTFDFAMRRRFRFIEITAEESQTMLSSLSNYNRVEAKNRMDKLNEVIGAKPDLGNNYQIGAAYFLKYDELGADKLWKDYLMPLILEYTRGLDYNIKDFEDAYYPNNIKKEDNNDSAG